MLKGLDGRFEARFLAQVQALGQRAQEQRADRLIRREVTATELSSRFRWLSGTLHLVVRKVYEQNDARERIEGFVYEFLNELDRITSRFEVLIQVWKAAEERVNRETWLGKKLRELGLEEIFKDGGLESFKELSQDCSRVICEHIKDSAIEDMLAAQDLNQLKKLLSEEIDRQHDRIFVDCEELLAADVVHRQEN